MEDRMEGKLLNNLKRRAMTLLLSLAMIITYMPLSMMTAYAAEGDYPVPDTSKELIDNEDGTYTLKLSVTGSAKTETENPKVNVVFIMDRSGSMNFSTNGRGYAYRANGRYGHVNGQYVPLYSRSGNTYTQITSDNYTGTVYVRSGSPGSYTYTQYTGTRYYYPTGDLQRDQVAIAAATSLSDDLLSYNTAANPNTVEMAFVSFNDMASDGNNGSWTTSATTARTTITGYDGVSNTGTNWEDALIHAKSLADAKHTSEPDEQMFIIFLTDGNPTRYVNAQGRQAGNGQETTTNIDTCYNEAAPRARDITNAGYELYNIGVFGSVDRMENLTTYANGATAEGHGSATYYAASNASALEAAFAEILRSITNSLALTDVKFTDGVTDMTHSTGVNGTPDNFQYTITVNGEETPWADAPEATVNANKEVIWDLSKDKAGNDLIIADGVTVTCSFLVWPDQDAMDLIADLNNKKVSYDTLTDEQKAQITGGPNGPFALKTNTECKLDYSILENRDGDIHEIPQDPITLDPPDPMPLYIDWLSLEKKWDDSLDPDQREEVEGKVVLDFYKDNTKYILPGYEDGITLTEAENWIKTDFLSIATGIMVSEESPAYDADKYPVVNYDGKDYCILETGHDYHFQEQDINDHYELTAYTYHPMLVDGELHNLTFEKDASGNITGVTEGAEISTVSATNTIKGGVSITKKVVDESGNEVDTDDPFTIVMHMLTPEGEPYSYDYRIYYGEHNPKYGTEDVAPSRPGGRSDHIYGDGDATVTIYAGDEIRFVNVDDDTRYYVEETNLQGYELDGMTYKIRYGDDPTLVDFTDDQKTTIDGKTYYLMQGNSSAAVEVVNCIKKGNLKVTKTVVNGDTDKEFEFTLELKDAEGEAVSGEFDYAIYKSSDDSKVEGSDGTISNGGTFKLKDGQYILVEGLPAGTEYTVTEAEAGGYTTTVGGETTSEATGDIVALETASAEFTNTYDASGEGEITVTKELAGAAWPAGKTLTFTLEGTGDAPMPTTTTATLTEEGDVTFGPIAYGLSDAGQTYTYTVSEDGFGDPWTGSGPVTATVTVTDNGTGTLNTEVTYSPSQTITNTYDAEGEATIEVKKALAPAGAEWPEGKILTFTIAGTGDAPMPETTTQTLSQEGSVYFGPIEYELEDAGKTYTYTISEDGFGGTWTSSGPVTATVTVTDNGTGTLNTEVTYSPSQTITNTYVAEGEGEITVTKELAGAAWPAGKTLTFTLEGTGDAPMPETTTATLSAAGDVTFGPIDLDESDAGQTYTYTISEDGFGEGWEGSGPVTATVVVTDNGDGTLSTEVTYSPEDKTITNTYTASGTIELEATKELVGRDWLDSDEFTFNLVSGEETLDSQTATSESKTVTFAELSFDQDDIGTHTYTITEDTDNLPSGVTKTSDDITVTVTVADNGDGTLDVTAEYTNSGKITNTYTASGEAVLSVTKELAGAVWPEGKTLTMTLSGEGGTLPETKTASMTAAGTATFDAITYDESDVGQTYTYTISEGEGFGTGWSKSGDVTATVTVRDNGDGTLATEITYSPEDKTIVNTYDAEGEAVIEVTKALAGAAWPEGKTLTLTLAGEGGTLPETTTATLTSAGRATFDPITYDESDIGQTYTYTISEDGFGEGWEGSGDVTATVTVSDNGDGTLSTEVTYTPDTATITNTYSATGSITLEAKKNLTGRDWMSGESFTFALLDEDGETIESKSVSSNTTVSFSEIEYTQEDAGEHVYTITETGTLPANVEKSADITATVTVVDNHDGTLSTSVEYSNNDTIINTYTPDPVKATIDVNKSIEGYLKDETGSADATFIFELYDEGGEKVDETSITTTDGSGSASFAEMTYEEVGTYTYTVKEKIETKAGFTYDVSEYKVVVTVTDNPEKGVLESSIAYEKEESAVTDIEFINKFKMKGTDVKLNLTKTIDDQSDSAHDSTFEFKLYKDSVSDDNLIATESITTKDLTGTVTFKDLDALKFDAAGEYKFVVVETDTGENGFTYDTEKHTYIVKINNNFDAAVLEVNEDDSTLDAEVVNVYKAKEVETSLTAEKEVNDTSGSAYETEFTFTLKDKDGTTLDTQSRMGPGSVEFAAITYEKAGTYTYTIQETAGDAAGYIYDSAEYKVKVTVEDVDGALQATAVYAVDESGEGGSDKLTITNTYDPKDAEVVLKATKVVEDRTGGATGKKFTFELRDASGSLVETVTRTGGGPVEFSKLTFSKVGEFAYTITEVAGSDKGYTYDTTPRDVTVTVTDPDKDGILKASVSPDPEEEEIVITNPYEAEPVSVSVEAEKVLKGRKLKGGEFTFQLLEDGEVIDETTNKADGSIVFGEITYEKAGNHYYTIVEVEGDDANITYDDGAYNVTVAVIDDGNGQLTVDVSGAPVFTNTYEEETPPPETPDEPDTGDTTETGGLLGLMGASMAGLLYMIFRRRREDHLQ